MRCRHHREDLCQPKTQAANHNHMAQTDAEDVFYAAAKAKIGPRRKEHQVVWAGRDCAGDSIGDQKPKQR